MENISLYLDALHAKIEKLIHLHRSLSEQNNNLIAEKQELSVKIKNQEQEIKQLNENYKVLKIAKSMAGETETNSDAKLKINELVREIDKCIGLLNK